MNPCKGLQCLNVFSAGKTMGVKSVGLGVDGCPTLHRASKGFLDPLAGLESLCPLATWDGL